MSILTTSFAILYALLLWYCLKRGKWTLNAQQTKVWIRIHFSLLILCSLLLWVSSQYGISLRGMWISRIFGWIFLITGILIFPIGFKPAFSNWLTKLYFFFFSALPSMIGLFLAIPFIGVVIGYSLLFRLTGTGDTIFYNDKDFRVQNTFQGVLGPPRLDVYKKEGLIERRVYTANGGWYYIDSIKTRMKNDSMAVLIYHDASEDTINPIKVNIRK